MTDFSCANLLKSIVNASGPSQIVCSTSGFCKADVFDHNVFKMHAKVFEGQIASLLKSSLE